MFVRWAFAGLLCNALLCFAGAAQPPSPASQPTAQGSRPEGHSPYRLNPAHRTGSAYAPSHEGVVYVDPDGNDTNDGLSEAKAVRSLAAGFARLADRRTMLLKRGGSYAGTLPRWTYSNRELGAYGTGSKPVIKTGGRPFLYKYGPEAYSNVSIRELVLDNEGGNGNLLIWIGGGQNLRIENCEFLSGGLVIQRILPRDQPEAGPLANVQLIGNKVSGAWNVAGKSHQSGLYGSGINGLEISGNTFDHNGWNPAKEGGHATMFNHNMYLSHVSNVTVRNNRIERAASIGIKFRSDSTGGSQNILVEGNQFLEGEFGISIGGNTKEPARFRNVRIVGNTFDRLGATQPTKRAFAWGIEVVDNVDAVVRDNVFLRMPPFGNQFLVRISGTQERVVAENNAIKQ